MKETVYSETRFSWVIPPVLQGVTTQEISIYIMNITQKLGLGRSLLNNRSNGKWI
jgi:sulfur transfer protein SufE